jgi:hypothetical protein
VRTLPSSSFQSSSNAVPYFRGGEGAYTDPYRLYNLDVFEYDADSEMAIVSFLRVSAPSCNTQASSSPSSTALSPS